MSTAYFKGAPLSGGVISAGAPIGTVISFMGTKAPEGYLVCDGSVYSLSAYPSLANFFREQFGSASYFGGDGITTFAVPDLRNLFLRGYHGEAEEQLSGEIGEKQQGTVHAGVTQGRDSNKLSVLMGSTTSATEEQTSSIEHTDTKIPSAQQFKIVPETPHWESPYGVWTYTSRPVNMAVLYCIKYTLDISGMSLEEYDRNGWHVRKWSNGYVEMSCEKELTNPSWASGSGTHYVSKDIISNLPLPLSLIKRYTVQTYAMYAGGNGSGFTTVAGEDPDPLTMCPNINVNGTSANVPNPSVVRLQVFITGRWK